jgi:predicted transcriptional regulator
VAVFRVHKTRDFTVMSNHHLRDKNLTLKAKGLLSVILSLPDDWKYSIAGLAAICKEGTSAVKSALQELTDAGYVTVTKLYPNQTETGRIEYVYDIHETPQSPRKQGVENLHLEFQQVENQGQLNTKEPSTDKSNTKDKELNNGARPKKSGFRPPTREEIRSYVAEKGYHFDPDHFFDYYDASDWHLQGGKKITKWKQCCVTWERRSGGERRQRTDADFSVYAQPKVGDRRIDGGKTYVYQSDGTWLAQEPTIFDLGDEDIDF